ncbi:hypothetical protein B296_00034589 [Ensete ventricosum]|uniref:Uncharacterized protein n=1 Tax=Ensete ventricosum TaxID=4639 RepID=A0A426YGD2_ENSVE|nr:hypothetical protein B296_00034589 [Ensete ventricosum]
MKCRMRREGKAVGRGARRPTSALGAEALLELDAPRHSASSGDFLHRSLDPKENSRVCSNGGGDEPRQGEKPSHSPAKLTLKLSCFGSWL